jgi:hypothetical protein
VLTATSATPEGLRDLLTLSIGVAAGRADDLSGLLSAADGRSTKPSGAAATASSPPLHPTRGASSRIPDPGTDPNGVIAYLAREPVERCEPVGVAVRSSPTGSPRRRLGELPGGHGYVSRGGAVGNEPPDRSLDRVEPFREDRSPDHVDLDEGAVDHDPQIS